MKKLLTLTIIFTFSVVLINCSASVENSPKSADSNSATARPVASTPSSNASDGKSDADKTADGKSDADKNSNGKSNSNTSNDGKSDADLSNSNK